MFVLYLSVMWHTNTITVKIKESLFMQAWNGQFEPLQGFGVAKADAPTDLFLGKAVFLVIHLVSELEVSSRLVVDAGKDGDSS
jgi:hypothetical protein